MEKIKKQIYIMETINISIIIPFYNRLKLVEKTIISVLRQTASNWELILVDDGTTEEGLEKLIKKYSSESVKFLKRDRLPKGAPTCRNIGAANSRFDYLLFFDSDDIMASYAIEERTKVIKGNIDKSFYIFDAVKLSNNNAKFFQSCIISPVSDPLLRFLRFQQTWATPCVVWKKDTFCNINGWDENVVSWQDGELHVRLLLNCNNYHWENPLPDSFVRIHDNRITNKSFNADKLTNRFATYNKVLNTLDANSFYYNVFKNNIEKQLYNALEFSKKEDIKTIRQLVKLDKIIIQNKTIFMFYSKLYELFGNTTILKSLFWQLRKIGIPNKRKTFFKERKTYTETEIKLLKEKTKNDNFIKSEFLFFY